MLEEIREIRASERKFYQKITDIYATALLIVPLKHILKKAIPKNGDQRLKTIEIRKQLTDEWDSRGVKKGERKRDGA